jgi:hypothetical protein
MIDPRRQRIREIADARGIPYGMLLPEELFLQCGYSQDEIDDLFSEGNEESVELQTYHLQDETDSEVLPIATVIAALDGTHKGKYYKTNHVMQGDFVHFRWQRELERLIYNLAVDRHLGLTGGGEKQDRSDWFASDQAYRRDDDLPYSFTQSIDEAVELFEKPPNRIPRNPIAVCIAALRSWQKS